MFTLFMSFQEYHLAKRYYDMATEASAEALVPANLALFKLNVVHYFSAFKEVHNISCVLVNYLLYFFPLDAAVFD